MKSLKEMEVYANDNCVPIIRKDNIEYLEKLIKEKKLYNILELGSAIGYSAIRMALTSKNVHVTTIERDEKMYLLSKAFHNDASIEEHAQQMLYYLLFHLDIFASKLDYNYSKKQWVKKITNSATSN